jgi:hypothetical protein
MRAAENSELPESPAAAAAEASPSSNKRKSPAASSDEPLPVVKKQSSGGKAPQTSGAKAVAAGAEEIPVVVGPRAERVAGGITFAHWNVGGLNGLLNNPQRRALLEKLVATEKPEVLAISEHKLSEEKLATGKAALAGMLSGYSSHWAVSTAKKGYSGVAVFVKEGVPVVGAEVDVIGGLKEGRSVMIELEHCFALAIYTPNSGQKLERLAYRLDTWEPATLRYLKQLEERKPVLMLGDLNVRALA